MSFTLKNNAYHILGLDISASEKDILKRSKEIINRLKADDVPDYDLDIGLFKDFRTEDAVKDALQRLQSPKKKLKEYFFWIQIADSIDEQALGLLKKKDYLNAVRIWQKAAEGRSTKAFFYKKNLAILYCLILSAEDNKEYLQSSLAVLKELVDSDKFWASFSKVYRLHDEQTASEDIVSDFKGHVLGYLSDIYTELYHFHKDSDYVNEFQRVFSAKGQTVEKSVLGPAYQVISEAVEGLEKMEVSKDGKIDKEESEMIKQLISTVQDELNKLIDLGLFEDSQTKILRDRSANALRSIALDLHNNLSELDKSQGFHEVAIMIAGTESLKSKLKDELEQIKKNIKDDSENTLIIDVPGKKQQGPVIFKNNFVQYDNKKIFYKDALSISFSSTHHTTSVYGIPVQNSYTYNWAVISELNKISLYMSASRSDGIQYDTWVKLVGLTSNLIEPHIIKKIVEQIFDRDEPVKIGNVEFSKLGYSRINAKLFGKGEKETVYWTDTVYIPKYDSGMVVLWKDKDGKGRQFTSVEMSTPNAVIIPELVQACINRA